MGDVKDFKKLSSRQQHILRFMHGYIQRNSYPPTIREIGEATGINSTSVVNYNLNKLVKAGYLERSDRVSRGLKLVAEVPGTKKKIIRMDPKVVQIPLIGQIVASAPVEVPDDIGHNIDDDDFIDVPPSLLAGVDPSQTYALRVKGDSMIDAMVSDGDTVILRHQRTANNGDMVAVWLVDRSETTLKYFYKEGGNKIRLQPAHPTMEAIYVDAANCEIHGKVLSIIRRVN